jgi:hypothetical protein
VKALRNKTSELSICILDQAAITKPEAIEDLKTLLDQNGGIWVLKEDGSEKEFLRRSKNFRLIIVGPSGLPSQNDPFRSQMQEIFMDFEYNAQELDVLFGLKE